MSNAIRLGTAFAATVVVAYTLCTIVFWAWPEAAANFMSGLFHGLDFRRLQSGPALFAFAPFVSTLFVLAVWAFGLAALFGWITARLDAGR